MSRWYDYHLFLRTLMSKTIWANFLDKVISKGMVAWADISKPVPINCWLKGETTPVLTSNFMLTTGISLPLRILYENAKICMCTNIFVFFDFKWKAWYFYILYRVFTNFKSLYFWKNNVFFLNSMLWLPFHRKFCEMATAALKQLLLFSKMWDFKLSEIKNYCYHSSFWKIMFLRCM